MSRSKRNKRNKRHPRFSSPFSLIVAAIVFVLVLGGVSFFIFNDSEKAKEKEEAPSSRTEATVSDQKEERIVEETKPTVETKEESSITFYEETDNTEEKVNRLVENMTLQEKIGQLLVVGFQSTEVDEHIRSMINDYHVGGVILFDRNMKTPEQVASLNNKLQDLAKQKDDQIPLWLSVDQEGGQIMRMKDQVTAIPSQQSLGKQGNPEEVYKVAQRNGKELATMGFNLNFAPVLDLSATDSRSFGENPEQAAQFGEKVVTGLNDAGIISTLKHFPGNGRSNIDPHIESSSVAVDKGDLKSSDIYPFKKIMDTVDHQRLFVMVTHIKYPAYDRENPASVSPIIIQDLLREELGFTGLVVTDDLEMGAVNKYYSYGDLGYKAVNAGADILLVCHTLEHQKEVFNGILKAIETKKISEERIDESVKRILTTKLATIEETHVDPVKAKKFVGK
ncbi:beta-N-acetylhexosaminidase [Niallia sp. Krafla_26]|uniref:beta-N-acetylhexosaminidase n=1 Tax=Niallia sp. Krafla_26 TaxID=3064703 RepID=UPI003D186920